MVMWACECDMIITFKFNSHTHTGKYPDMPGILKTLNLHLLDLGRSFDIGHPMDLILQSH